MNESTESNYIKLRAFDKDGELNLTGNQTHLENDNDKTQLQLEMALIEKTGTKNDLALVAQQIKQSTSLEDSEKHNLVVDLNAADWELSKARKVFSFVVLVLLTLGQMAS